jgi:non-heme chloroperoxidase
MGTITTTDGTETYYKGWGAGQPIVFRHGWPLSADDWDTLLYFLRRGYRVIAHDRRSHGRSTQTADGHDMYHYADDLAALTTYLDLHDTIHVGHSTGGGEVAHYIARHGENRLAKAVLISANASAHGADHSIPGGLPKSQSTACRPNWPRTARCSTATWPPDRSTDSTGPAWNPPKRSSRTGGAKE